MVGPQDRPLIKISFAVFPSMHEDAEAVKTFAAGIKGKKYIDMLPTSPFIKIIYTALTLDL